LWCKAPQSQGFISWFVWILPVAMLWSRSQQLKGVALGAIRIFLALSVVTWHLWGHASPFTANGYNAVILFFIISGFYMSMIVNGKYSHKPILNFYLARVLRIYPIYLLILILSVWFRTATGNPLPVPTTTPERLFSALTNITIFEIPWLSNWDWLAIPPAWSLAVELQFYLAAPFILSRRIWVCVAVLLGLIALRLSLLDQDFTHGRFTVPRADWCFFMLGAVSHRLGLLLSNIRLRNRLGWLAAVMLPIVGFLCGIPIVKDLDRPELWFFYVIFAAAIPFVFSISMRSRVDRFLGDLSYPIYVSHWLLIAVVEHFSGTFYKFLPYAHHREIDLIIVVFAAAVLHATIEMPIEKVRQRLSAPSALGLRDRVAGAYKASRAATAAE
jgi:peptidoglycan/LPS O-acetylase OafA/YrhL